MIGRKDENRFIILIELRNETLGPIHDVVHNFDVFHVFLTGREAT